MAITDLGRLRADAAAADMKSADDLLPANSESRAMLPLPLLLLLQTLLPLLLFLDDGGGGKLNIDLLATLSLLSRGSGGGGIGDANSELGGN